MKIRFLSLLFLSVILSTLISTSQVTIGADKLPDPDAVLDLQSNERYGLLLPRVNLYDSYNSAPMSRHVEGMVVYNTNYSYDLMPGYYYNNGYRWVRLADFENMPPKNESWQIQGNYGTDANWMYVGTNDHQPLVFRVNNRKSGLLDMDVMEGGKGNTSFGYEALQSANQNTTANTAVGVNALYSNITSFNTAFGYSSLADNTTGMRNVSVGSNNLGHNITGSNNTSVGANALQQSNADYNTAFGSRALVSTTKGAQNTAIGGDALSDNREGSANVAVGFGALTASRGDNNTAVGAKSLSGAVLGVNNVAIGNNAAMNLKGVVNNNIAIGSEAYLPKADGSNQMNIGNILFGTDMTGGVNNPEGKLGVNVIDPTTVLDIDGDLRVRQLSQSADTDFLVTVDVNGVVKQSTVTLNDLKNSANNNQTGSWTTGSPIIIEGLPGTEDQPVKALNPENDFIRSRNVGGKEIEVDFLYSAVNEEGAEVGGSDYLFTLPDGYAFDFTFQKPYTGSLYDKRIVDVLPYLLRATCNVLISDDSNSTYQIIPYNETQFRITSYYSGGSVSYAIGWELVPLSQPKLTYAGRFIFSAK